MTRSTYLLRLSPCLFEPYNVDEHFRGAGVAILYGFDRLGLCHDVTAARIH